MPVREAGERVLAYFAAEIVIRQVVFRFSFRQFFRAVPQAAHQRNIVKIVRVPVQDPVRFEIGLNTVGGDPFIIGGEDGPTAIWLTTPFDVIPFISVIVFVVLGLICIWLIKSTNSPKQES